jgi:hypothetical protein
MPTYYRYTIQGHHAPDAALAKLGPAASHGLVVRVDTAANETHVIIAADAPPGPAHAPPLEFEPQAQSRKLRCCAFLEGRMARALSCARSTPESANNLARAVDADRRG